MEKIGWRNEIKEDFHEEIFEKIKTTEKNINVNF